MSARLFNFGFCILFLLEIFLKYSDIKQLYLAGSLNFGFQWSFPLP